ncbi:MAG TPA: NYN domain-containing protein, partial [Gammaproteobacteria bacterium]|nr:NYN domain-containing protein [Gammaproteobacteria bacterium]
VSKLKENDKRVVGCGVRKSTSDLLANNCDEFIFYDDLIRVQKRTQQKQTRQKQAQASGGEKEASDGRQQEAFDRVLATVASLESDYDPVWGSQVKQSVKRVYPGFNESYYGYRSFSDLLEDAAKAGVIAIELDAPSGNYRVRSA